jgi:DEAD/DEAH box helicase domain-containing protein
MNLLLDFGLLSNHHQPTLSPVNQSVTALRRLMEQDDSPVRAIRHQPQKAGQYREVPANLDVRLAKLCRERGWEKLYSHQADSIDLSLAGKNVAVVTPTASGKTLCYNLPVVHMLLRDPAARALYLFPTKALAEDQKHELDNFLTNLQGPLTCSCYDGDTPQDVRKSIRKRANIILTNPEMLHSGVLPHHTKWANCFENLRYLVIDELHYYRGVYGSHLANIIRRLKRICEFYGSSPQFICSSATVGNPKQLAELITGESVDVIETNGAPCGEKYFIFYNPPHVNRQLGIRRSYLQESRRIAIELVRQKLQTLVFANSRLATEVLTTYLKDATSRMPFSHEAVRGYRGGYLPKERREVEKKLRAGELRAVVATNALELGVDIGTLDAVVLAGYPGTIASTWQRGGRAGRRQEASLCILVASSAPLDQYVVEHPEYFFDQTPEHAYINADNLEILLNHVKCAAFELPLRDSEKFGPNEIGPLCAFLSDELQLLHHSGDAWHWVSDSYPANAVSLRSVTSDNFVVVDITGDHKVIAEVDFSSALTTLYEKAIYLHDARQYQVEKFDYDGRKAFVRHVDSDYFTDAIVYTEVKETSAFETALLQTSAKVICGEVRIKTQVVGFKKIKFYSLENVGAGQLSLPEQEMHTTAVWFHFASAFIQALPDLSPVEFQNGLSGAGNVLKTIGALLLMCDVRDIGLSIADDIAAATGAWEPDLFLYDNFTGGAGHSRPLFEMRDKLLSMASALIRSCPCDQGCPSCVGPLGEIGELGKQHTSLILQHLIQTAPV